MLTEPIMHSCIMALFKAKDDDHLESLCRLLTTIGKDLDSPKAKVGCDVFDISSSSQASSSSVNISFQQRINQYFDQIRKIIGEKRTSSRVRFMLQDVTDLRAVCGLRFDPMTDALKLLCSSEQLGASRYTNSGSKDHLADPSRCQKRTGDVAIEIGDRSRSAHETC